MTLIVDNKDKPASSMTKREAVAMHFMANLLSEGRNYLSSKYYAEQAFKAADAFFEQLEKSQ